MTDPSLVLIAEDNEKNLKLVRDLLQFHGFRTIEARTGREAVTIARQESPDLILMDIEMPDMDGVEALRLLRSDTRTSHIPVVAVTASAMLADRQRLAGAGFDGYIIKPISVQQFPVQVRSYLERPAS